MGDLAITKGVTVGSFEFGDIGLRVVGDPTFNEWLQCGQLLLTANRAIQFWVGDWLNYGEQRWGEMYTQAIDMTGYDYQTLANEKYIASRIDFYRRRENLSFSHHAEVAALPPEEQDYWLDKAESEGLTRSELRRLIKTQKALSDKSEVSAEGNVKVYCGDILDVAPCIHDVDLILADPPLDVERDKFGDEYLTLTLQWLDTCIDTLRDEYTLFWFCSPKYVSGVEKMINDEGLIVQSRIVWHHPDALSGHATRYNFQSSWDMVFHCGNRPLNFISDSRLDVQTFEMSSEDVKVHPSQKPIALIRWLLRWASCDGDTILDPFAGKGVTGQVCKELGRNCILVV